MRPLLVFVRRTILEQENRSHSEGWMVDAAGREALFRLTTPSTEASNPRSSPDGRLLAFTSRRTVAGDEDRGTTEGEQIFVLPRGGGEARRLTSSEVDARSPSGRPDGTALAFVADAHGRDEHTHERSDLWVVTLEGALTRLTDDEIGCGSPAWSPDSEWIVARGNMGLDVVIREKWDHGAPVDLWVFSADGKERRNLTPDFDLIPGEPTWSPDGRWIWFTAQAGGSTHLYRIPAAGGAAKPNTAGDRRVGTVSFSNDFSTVAYAAQTAVDPGDVLVAKPTDARRIKRRLTDLIVLGISNRMSDYGTADILRTKESEFFGSPWEEEGLENLLASSPIVHAKGVTTPTLFVHGEFDNRVPIEEADQMCTALQKQGVPASMIRYPESYQSGWTPWRTLHRYGASIQWWDRWLKSSPVS